MSDANQLLSNQYIHGKSGCAVILLPGLQGTPLELGSIPRKLVELGYAIYYPKIEGYIAGTGISDYEEWLIQLDGAVELLAQDHQSIALIGLSMGATLALAYQGENQKCAGVVALAPVLAYDGWTIPWYYPLLHLIFTLGIKGWNYKESEPFGLRNLEVRRRVARQVAEQEISEVGASALTAKHLYQGLRLIDFTKSILREIKSKLLLIGSIDDDVVSPQTIELIKQEVASDTVRIVWLGNSYHIITLDNEREIVVNETVEFIDQIFQQKKSSQIYSDEAKQLMIRARLSD